MSFFLTLVVGWIYGKVSGFLILILAIFTMVLDTSLQCWRKKKFNELIEDIKSNKIGEIK